MVGLVDVGRDWSVAKIRRPLLRIRSRPVVSTGLTTENSELITMN